VKNKQELNFYMHINIYSVSQQEDYD